MHKKFDNQAIEKKWQEKWQETGIYNVGDRDESKEKEYVLAELPYPSGNLHIGHWYAFAVPDIYVRYLRMSGKQVVYPMGFDAFGLPAENAAIKRDINPREWTESNIEYMKGQLQSMGAAFSWDKTASTIDPNYYKWTQWMFTEFFKHDIAYRGEGIVNWCPGCNTVIANEQVLSDGTCERSGDVIEKRKMPQWMLKITDYADRLVDDLDALNWPEHIKEAQRQWIGRSKGAEISFELFFTYKPEVNENRGPNGEKAAIPVFTTRPDTLFGATYMVLAPEHPWVTLAIDRDHDVLENKAEVAAYVATATQKDEIERTDASKEKTGVELKGVKAINPATGEQIPLYVADYVLGGYGTGAIMAVPAHDERDFAFAKKFGIPVKQVVRRTFGEKKEDAEFRKAVGAFIYDPKTDKYLFVYSKPFKHYSCIFGGLEAGETYEQAAVREALEETGYKTTFRRFITGETEANFFHPGKNIERNLLSRVVLLEVTEEKPIEISEEEKDKHELVWLSLSEAKIKMTEERQKEEFEFLEKDYIYTGIGVLCNSGEFDGMDSEEAKEAIVKKVGGRMTNTYRLRDWSVGRQRYWGVPIPIVYDPEGKAHAIPEEHLPWTLPEDVDFKPTGVAPLAKSQELKDRTEKIFGKGWTPEVETLDTFVDSSWYFLRYLDNQNDSEPVSKEVQKGWMPIDIYFGGAEHTTMHLLYSRFWQKALCDLGHLVHQEPYLRRINRGLILGPDGNKMSKSKGNVIDPDEQVARVGADTVKMYLAFMGPYGEAANYPWDMGGIAGLRRFLERVNGLSEHLTETEPESVIKQLHKTIKKVREDVPQFKFNTAISTMMVFVNLVEKAGLSKETYSTFLRVLAPFATHLTEELWMNCALQHNSSGPEQSEGLADVEQSETGQKWTEANSIHSQPFPAYDESLATDDTVTIGVQINGKVRGDITISPEASEAEAIAAARLVASIASRLSTEPTKIIYKPGKILNLIVPGE